MKSIPIFAMTSLMALAIGCGGGSSMNRPVSLSGSWTISTIDQSDGDTATINASLVPATLTETGTQTMSNCTVSVNTGSGGIAYLMVPGINCFVALNEEGAGSISGSGDLLYPPTAIVGQTNNQISLVFIEGETAAFTGTGTISGNEVSGSWQCYSLETPVCSQFGGSFSGTKN